MSNKCELKDCITCAKLGELCLQLIVASDRHHRTKGELQVIDKLEADISKVLDDVRRRV